MSKIAYDPVKNRFANIIKNAPFLRRIFYFILDLLFLRGWHMRRLLGRTGATFEQRGEWKLLDAGCGFGQYDRFILDKFSRVQVTSVDVKEDYLEDCRRYFEKVEEGSRIEFLKADLLRLDYEESFDVVICIDVLEHIEEDLDAIRSCARALKPGGSFLMHSPSHYSAEDAGSDDTFVGEHARAGYSKRDIASKMEAAGLAVDTVRYTYGKFGHLSWVLSIKYPMIWLNRVGMGVLPALLLYYPIVLPACLLLNLLDLLTENEKGNGVYAVGVKK